MLWLATWAEDKEVKRWTLWLKKRLLEEAKVKGVEARQRLEQYFREEEQWGTIGPPIERDVEVEDGVKVRIEVEVAIERGKTKEYIAVKVRAKVIEEGCEAAWRRRLGSTKAVATQ